MSESAAFDQVGRGFVDHYDTVRGHVRQAVTQANLFPWLKQTGQEVLDFGGGDGRDALWLAEMDDNVTLLDESQEMINMAKARMLTDGLEVIERVKIVHGGLNKLTKPESFDVVLNHCVLMYELDDPMHQLRTLSGSLKTGGILSLLIKGNEAARSQLTRDDAALDEFDRTGRYVNNLGWPAQAYSYEQMKLMLERVGLKPSDKGPHGVRVFSDDNKQAVKDVPQDELAAIVSQEIEASNNPAFLPVAQLQHIIAVKQ
ncbi:MAG: methyltransferase domain-containing protein [Patescibacteria group bacterium]